jgi:hypothetical protein
MHQAGSQPSNYYPMGTEKETRDKANYYPDLYACNDVARSKLGAYSATNPAIQGALAGAGISALTGAVFGVNGGGIAQLAGVGAVAGGLGNTARHYSAYEQTVIMCLRDKGHQVY